MNFEEKIADFYADLLFKQEPLGEEFEKVLYENLWDLYITEEKVNGISSRGC